MKENYQEPEIEILVVDSEDIITTSGDFDEGQEQD